MTIMKYFFYLAILAFITLATTFAFEAPLIELLLSLVFFLAVLLVLRWVFYFILFLYRDEETRLYFTIPILMVSCFTFFFETPELEGIVIFASILGMISVVLSIFSVILFEIFKLDYNNFLILFKKIIKFFYTFIMIYFWKIFFIRFFWGILSAAVLSFYSLISYIFKVFIRKGTEKDFKCHFLEKCSSYLFVMFIVLMIYLISIYLSSNFVILFVFSLFFFRKSVIIFYEETWKKKIIDESSAFSLLLKFSTAISFLVPCIFLSAFVFFIGGDEVLLNFLGPIFDQATRLNPSYVGIMFFTILVDDSIIYSMTDFNCSYIEKVDKPPLRKDQKLDEALLLISSDMLVATPDPSISDKIKGTFVAMNHNLNKLYRAVSKSQSSLNYAPFFKYARLLPQSDHGLDLPFGSLEHLEKHEEVHQSLEATHSILLAAENLSTYNWSVISSWKRLSPNEQLFACPMNTVLELDQIRDTTMKVLDDGSVYKYFLNSKGKLVEIEYLNNSNNAEEIKKLMSLNVLAESNQTFLNGELAQRLNTGDFVVQAEGENGSRIINHVEVKTCWSDKDKYFGELLEKTESKYPIHDLRVIHVPSETLYTKKPGDTSWKFTKIDDIELNDDKLNDYFKASNDFFKDHHNFERSVDIYTDDLIAKISDRNKPEE